MVARTLSMIYRMIRVDTTGNNNTMWYIDDIYKELIV